MKVSPQILDRIEASLLMGALGDSLGAAVEIWPLARILQETDGQGVTKLLPYDPGEYLKYAPCEQTGLGVITDDTCMMAATAAGLLMARQMNALEDPAYYLHQAYLVWGQHQAWAQGDYQARFDTRCIWPDWFASFCFSSGAGQSTLAALNSGLIGSFEHPILIPNKKSGDAPIASDGCGGMMRVAPVGWLSALEIIARPYHMGCVSAAITHGGVLAHVASGALAQLIFCLVQGNSWRAATHAMLDVLSLDASATQTLHLARAALLAGYELGENITFENMDTVPEGLATLHTPVLRSERFMAGYVLVQALLLGEAMQQWAGTVPARAFRAMTFAVTHSGDSDTLGAIIGNLIGAQLGTECLPLEMVGKLQNFAALKALNAELRTLAA